MKTHEVHLSDSAMDKGAAAVDMKLEVVIIPVSDVSRAKEFYARLGWRLDADFRFDNGSRLGWQGTGWDAAGKVTLNNRAL